MLRRVSIRKSICTVLTMLGMAIPSIGLANMFDGSGYFGGTNSSDSFSDDSRDDYNDDFNYEIRPSHILVTLGGGISDANKLGQSKTFPIEDTATDEFYIYNASGKAKTKGLFDIFVGGEWWNLYPTLGVQLGLAYAQVGSSITKGTFLQGMDVPSEDLYHYKYKVLTRRLLAETKLLYRFCDQPIYPYISIGLGAAFNRASNYTTTVPPFITFTRQYANKTQTSFSYALGLGLDVNVIKHVRLGIGYRFSDLGTAKLGGAVIGTTPVSGTLSKSNIYANEVFGTITLLA